MVRLSNKRQIVKLGKPLKASFAENCTGCKNYFVCRDPDKSLKHLCSKFTSIDAIMDETDRRVAEAATINPPKAEHEPKRREWSAEDAPETQRDLREMMKRELRNGVVKQMDYSSKQIDDSDFPLSNNFYHFMRSKSFCGNKDMTPFAKQIEIGIGFLSEWCPRCSDAEWIMDVPVDSPLKHFRSKAQLLHKGVCPSCGVRKSELIATEELYDYFTLAGLAGQRGSKSILASMISTYGTHRQLKLSMPPVDYGLLPNQVLTATFVAPTFKQAFDNLWTPFSSLIELSSWFQNYHKMLDHYGQKNGEELFKYMDTFLSYRHKNLMISASAADGRTLRGYTRFGTTIDELGWFGINDKNIKLNADQVYTALDRSLFTLKNAVTKRRKRGNDILPAPMSLNISSPSSWQDRICRLVKEAEGSKTIYSFTYATWEMNPEVSRDHPDLVQAEKDNRSTFLRDYAAQPPMSFSPFIDDITKFKALFKYGAKNPVIVTRDKQQSRTGRMMTGAYISKKNWRNVTGRCLAIDAGSINNSFALAMGRVDPEADIPIIEALIEVMPYDQHPINFSDVFDEIIKPLIERYGVAMLAVDRWQSMKILSDAENLDTPEEFQVEQYSLKKPDFVSYRDAIFDGGIILPKPEMKLEDIMSADSTTDYREKFADAPISHFYFQNVTVVESPKSVDKGPNATDDLFRATVLCHRCLMHPEFKELFSGDNTPDYGPNKGLGMAVVTGGGGGTSSASTSAPGIVIVTGGGS